MPAGRTTAARGCASATARTVAASSGTSCGIYGETLNAVGRAKFGDDSRTRIEERDADQSVLSGAYARLRRGSLRIGADQNDSGTSGESENLEHSFQSQFPHKSVRMCTCLDADPPADGYSASGKSAWFGYTVVSAGHSRS